MDQPDPVPLHRVTLAALMDCADLDQAFEASVAAGYMDPAYLDKNMIWNPRAAHLTRAERCLDVGSAYPFAVEGFTVAHRNDLSGGAILAVYEAATRTVAAGIDGKNLYVAPEYRGRGIGPEMLILAFEAGLRHPDEMNVENTLSRSGRANRAVAHRMAVERALEAGLDVPPEVLEAYPDLVPGPCP